MALKKSRKPPLDPKSPSEVVGFRLPKRTKDDFEKRSRLLGFKSASARLQELVRLDLLKGVSA